MKLQKFRWSKVYESPEEELVMFLQSRGITADIVVGEFGDQDMYEATEHAATLWCAEGSFSLQVADQQVSMQPGDAVRLPEDIGYTIVAGISGYRCFISR